MIANGGNEVNAIRSITNQCIATSETVIDQDTFFNITNLVAQNISLASDLDFVQAVHEKPQKRVKKADLKKGSLKEDPPNLVEANVYIELRASGSWDDVITDLKNSSDSGVVNRIKNIRHCGKIVKATVILDDLQLIASSPNIVGIEGTQSVLTPPLINLAVTSSPKPKGLKLDN